MPKIQASIKNTSRLLVGVVISSLLAAAFFCGQQKKYPVSIGSATGPIDGTPSSIFAQAHSDGENIRVVVRDYFYSARPFSAPYITFDSYDSATIHVDIKNSFSLTSSKCEFQRQIVILIPVRFMLGRAHLFIENHDVEHIMTVNLDDQHHKNRVVFDEKFIETQVAC